MRTSLVLVLVSLGCWQSHAAAYLQLEDEELEVIPGLQAAYQSGATTIRRIDADISFDWKNGSPDPRIAEGPFEATWTGQLFVRRSAKYVFSARLAGSLEFELAGETVLSASTSKEEWVRSKELDVAFGFQLVTIRYRRTGEHGRVGLYWESEQFPLEPIPSDRFFRDPQDKESGHDGTATLVRSRRCAACHDLNLPGFDLPAPSLTRLKGAIHSGWLVDYLQNPAEQKAHVTMPQFGLSDSQARDIAAYLTTAGSQVSLKAPPKGNVQNGKSLVERLGCLACHQIDGKGKDAPFGGGDLSRIAAKRPSGFFALWLKDPKQLNTHHRMPVFDLDQKEINDLSVYLASLGKTAERPTDLSQADAENGKKLLAEKRCAACHEIPGVPAPASRLGLALAEHGCLGPADAKTNRPGYSILSEERDAIVAYLKSLAKEPVHVATSYVGRQLLREKGCLNCHSRGNDNGLREVVAQLGVTDPKAQAALVPPSLNSLGDKMQLEWLSDAVSGQARRLRPWLAPRMPKFQHTDQEREALIEYFVAHDRIPDPPQEPDAADLPGREQLLLGAHQLVGGSGMGCMSCHTIGKYEPQGVELGARGSDLRFIGERLRQPWFRRWTRNPARIVPGVEMPAITLATPNILDGKIRTQLEALWEGLNAPQFDLPTADAVQLLTAATADRTLILRDPFEHGDQDYTTRPFAVGLPNGHSLLLDLDSLSLRRWWVGDFAREKTRGKTWYWETAGVTLYDNPKQLSLLALWDSKLIQPQSTEQAVCRLTSYEHLKDGVRLNAALEFEGRPDAEIVVTIRAMEGGFSLEVEPKSGSAGSQGPLRLQFPPSMSVRLTDRGQLALTAVVGKGTVSAGPDAVIQSAGDSDAPYVVHTQRDTALTRIEFTTDVAPPYAARRQQTFALPAKAKDLPCAPGYEVTRLPLDDGPMPTALAWRPDGTLAASSLKGQVFLVKDSDGDGLLDQYVPFSDHLAAPYGLMVDGQDVVVSHKPELLKLIDADGDGFAERTQVLASGWGVTFDYHDWAVGVLRDAQGNWYITPSCQQDDRTLAAAKGRGKMLKIDPSGKVEEFAAGIRFAMGLAMNDRGDIFATDNQGVTNPFNELNHIQPGRHYAFWSKLEPRPENQETTLPAIQIPHPWTRSVNGIAFVPEGVDFGPFAGHLIGADYTTRKLVRMSLQAVGDTYQGCAYPFSLDDLKLIEGDQTFLGPISLAFGPDGALYVGSMIDSGWGGGNNRGAIERVRFKGPIPFGIREVTAHARGFDIHFTGEVDSALALDPGQYSLSCYRRIHQGGYDTPDQDRTNVQVKKVVLARDKRSVRLLVDPLKPTYVYDIAIGSLHGGKEKPFPEVAYYTLNAIPQE